MNLKHDEPLSRFAFNVNLRRYNMVGYVVGLDGARQLALIYLSRRGVWFVAATLAVFTAGPYTRYLISLPLTQRRKDVSSLCPKP